MDLLEDTGDASASHADTNLLLTDTSNESSHIDTATYLLQNEIVDIPSRSCALIPLIDKKSEISGLFLLSLPQPENASLISAEEMEIIKETRTLLLSALDQYQSVIHAQQSAQLQEKVTKSILKEGKGAVKSVRSFAKMLSFRPSAGTLEKDMIHGIERQGERMSDVVQRLETALNSDPKHLPVFSPFVADALSMTPPPSYLDN